MAKLSRILRALALASTMVALGAAAAGPDPSFVSSASHPLLEPGASVSAAGSEPAPEPDVLEAGIVSLAPTPAEAAAVPTAAPSAEPSSVPAPSSAPEPTRTAEPTRAADPTAAPASTAAANARPAATPAPAFNCGVTAFCYPRLGIAGPIVPYGDCTGESDVGTQIRAISCVSDYYLAGHAYTQFGRIRYWRAGDVVYAYGERFVVYGALTEDGCITPTWELAPLSLQTSLTSRTCGPILVVQARRA